MCSGGQAGFTVQGQERLWVFLHAALILQMPPESGHMLNPNSDSGHCVFLGRFHE